MSSINAQNEVSVGSCPTCGQLCQFVALGGDQDQIDYVPLALSLLEEKETP